MPTTRDDIRGWFKEGRRKHATHMIVVCDTFDYDDYPVYVGKKEDVRAVYARYNGPNMQRVMEVYNLSLDMEKQLTEHRSFNF